MTLPAPYAPMLAMPATVREISGSEWLHEFKWDGVRVIAQVTSGELHLWSRRGNEVTVAWPELAGLADILPDGSVIDGEVVVLDDQGRPSFSLVASRMHVRSPPRVARLRATTPARLMAFDLLSDGQTTMIERPIQQRRARLGELLPPSTFWAVPPTSDDLAAILSVVRQRGLEGVVSKRPGSDYRPGRRSQAWRKLRVVRDIDAVVIGFRGISGVAAGPVGSLAIARHDNGAWIPMGSVGSGIGDAEGQRLRQVLLPLVVEGDQSRSLPDDFTPVRPDVVVRVGYLEATPGGQLRHPVYKGQRDDAVAVEVTDRP